MAHDFDRPTEHDTHRMLSGTTRFPPVLIPCSDELHAITSLALERYSIPTLSILLT